MTSFWPKSRDERGVTLLELLAVVTLISLVIGAVVAFSSHVYRTSFATTQESEQQREANDLLRQVSVDLRQATAVTALPSGRGYRISTGTGQTVEYETLPKVDGTTRVERRSTSPALTVTMADPGTLTIHLPNGPLVPASYPVTVVAGSTSPVQLTTTVAPYDWRR